MYGGVLSPKEFAQGDCHNPSLERPKLYYCYYYYYYYFKSNQKVVIPKTVHNNGCWKQGCAPGDA